jgi:hypothetical protein
MDSERLETLSDGIAICGHAVDGGIQIGDVGLLRVGHDHKIV